MKQYAVYIMTNPVDRVLYVGFTSNLLRRVQEHRDQITDGFTKKYNCVKLVYYEIGEDYEGVLGREKQIKGWTRKKKEFLINKINSEWRDLFDDLI